MPLSGFLLLLTLTAVFVMWAFHKSLQYDELERRALRVAAALESADERYASAVELVAFTNSFGRETASLADLALLNSDEVIVVATQETWRGKRINQVEALRSGRRDETWTVDGSYFVFLLPVRIDNDAITNRFGGDLSALVVIDATDLLIVGRDVLIWVLAVTLIGSTMFLFGAFRLVKSRVLDPISKIHSALTYAAEHNKKPSMPYLYPDEIGRIAGALKSSFDEISVADRDMRVMSNALEASSNEVYVVNANTLRLERVNRAAEENLGYASGELIDMRIAEIAPDNDNPKTLEELTRQLEEKGEISHVYEHVRRDGTTYPFEFKAVLMSERKHPVLIVIGQNVSKRLEQEEALRRSEERVQLALEGSNDGLFDLDAQSDTFFISDLVQRWLRKTSQVIPTGEVLACIDPEHRDMVEDAIQKALQEGNDFDVEFRLINEPLGGRWLQIRGKVRYTEGDTARLTGFASDVTRRKVAENMLQTTVSRLSAVLDTIADGILILDDVGRVRGVNPAALTMFGMDKDDLTDHHLGERLRMVDAPSGPDWLAISDGELRECIATRADGAPFAAEIAVMRMDAVADEHYTVLVRDISARKVHEEELRAAMEDAQAATRAKGEFLATMSHEIRTPMNGVLGMTQLLLDMDLNAQQRETAEIIFSSGEALLTLINDILDFSKIEAGKLELEHLPFDMRSAIKEVMDLLASNARRKSLDLYIDYPADLPFACIGDVGRIRQILLNLVGNAVKFTAQGHVLVKVTAEQMDADNVCLRIGVRDTGPGIETNVQQSLFDSFTQADASTTRRYGGTGLGLAICRQLVELMGGDIGIESEPGEGAEFWFALTLPLSHAGPEEPSVSQEKLAGMRVLAVDDNPVGLQIVEGMVASLGMQVVATHDPQSVMDIMAAAHDAGAPYEVVILDYNMPGLDGLTLATSITGDDRFADAKLVMLTSSELSAPRGLDGYALKPLMREGLARLLTSACFDEGESARRNSAFDDVRQVGQNVRVLVAEDNPVNQRVAVRMLERLGCRVDVAANGREAVEMWEQFPYAMIFMDCQMPELDGLAATEEIRRLEERRQRAHTPIVAMTANAMQQDQDDCRAAGMDDYASKPVKLDLLQELVGKWSEAP